MNQHYESIISLPHHVSRRHTPMSLLDRAAQFAPFAALSGYGEAIEMTGEIEQQVNERRWGWAEPYLEDTCRYTDGVPTVD